MCLPFVHAGGKSALELKGYGHYLSAGKRRLFLYACPGTALPAWFQGDRLGVDLVVTRTGLFPADSLEGFSEWKERELVIRISAPERAVMEMLYLVPGTVGIDEAFLVMESLTTLRSDLVQTLLESCRSIKVKRLFMHMAERQGHAWLEKVDLGRVNLGKGKRMIIPHGAFDPKYQITVPKCLDERMTPYVTGRGAA